MVQIGEKDQGCKMINGVEKQYPKANQSVIQKAKYGGLKNLSVKTKIPKFLKNYLNNKRINKIYQNFSKSLNLNENFAIAVSGGPDSLALAFGKSLLNKKKNFIKVLYSRSQTKIGFYKEAYITKKLLKKFSISAKILT